MVKELIHDPVFLARPARPATAYDRETAADLLDTLLAHRADCVGMAANMIGVSARIIAFLDESGKTPCFTVMLNPVLLKAEGGYETKESCLSLLGGPRSCRRFRKIRVQFQTVELQTRIKTYDGFTAQIIQHEIDHTNGILI